jgi:hypothetical protein
MREKDIKERLLASHPRITGPQRRVWQAMGVCGSFDATLQVINHRPYRPHTASLYFSGHDNKSLGPLHPVLHPLVKPTLHRKHQKVSGLELPCHPKKRF